MPLSPNRTDTRPGLATAYPFGGILLAVCLLAAGCHSSVAKDHDKPAREPAPVNVTVAAVQVRPVERAVEAVGTLQSFEEVAISAKVEGRVKRIAHDVSDRVKPGEMLLEIDPTDYELSVRQAEQALAIELAKLGLQQPPQGDFDVATVPAVKQATAKMENSKTRLERIKTLAAKQASSAEELADRTADARMTEAELSHQMLLAKANLATALMKQEALSMARQQRKDTAIIAPTPTQEIPGITEAMVYAVSQRSVAEGTFVKGGTEVCRLVIDQALKMKACVAERYVSEIKIGQQAKVFTAGRTQPVIGQVTRIKPVVDPLTRTFEVEVLVPNPNAELKPGGFAKTSIRIRQEDRATTVPLEAVVRFAGVIKIFVLEEGRAKELQVKLGVQSSDWVEIIEPQIAPESQVVTSGQNVIASGTALVVRQAQRPDTTIADAHADAKR